MSDDQARQQRTDKDAPPILVLLKHAWALVPKKERLNDCDLCKAITAELERDR
jgi:hypothetical protein